MNKHADFKRTKIFLKNSSQPLLILKIYGILLTVMIISGGIFYFLGNKNLTNEMFAAHSVIKSTMQLLLPALIVVNIVGLLGAAFLVVTFSHSIVGPVHRLKHLSEKIAKGDLTLRVEFRKKDSMHELSGVINGIVEGLNTRLKGVEGSLDDLSELSSKVHNIDNLSQPELLELKKSLISVSSELEAKIKEFKL